MSGSKAEVRSEMEGGEEGYRRGSNLAIDDFTRMVLSWSLQDVYDDHLYKYQVEKIPDRFDSVEKYLGSFVYPLLEETRDAIRSSLDDICKLPLAEVTELYDSKKSKGEGLYDVRVDKWKNRFSDSGKEPYSTLPGDLLILVDAKPETVSDLQRTGRTWTFASVVTMSDGDGGYMDLTATSMSFKIAVLKGTEVNKGIDKQMFAIFLENLISNKRIWKAIHMSRNPEILEKVLSPNYSLGEEDVNHCLVPDVGVCTEDLDQSLFEDLNESQVKAVRTCLMKIQHQQHDSMVELIWGPPGTGKTKTQVPHLCTNKCCLLELLKMKRRCLICAPTNVAIKEVASRVFLLRCHSSETNKDESSLCALGDILIFGSKERLKVCDSDLEMIQLDYRAERLATCIAPLTGWQHRISSTLDFLNDAISQYHLILENESSKKDFEAGSNMSGEKSFVDFVKERFECIVRHLSDCLSDMCTHLSRKYISESCQGEIITALRLLNSFGTLLHGENLISVDLEEAFSCEPQKWHTPLQLLRHECVAALVAVRDSLRTVKLLNSLSLDSIKKFCLQSASMIFCTASSAFRLHHMEMEPIDILVIDEAAQLKECESVIPLQLSRISHVILVGDEQQLPAMVKSKVCEEAGFGRSLFERLSSLGHLKHLLNTQYRMHPMISLFPNNRFYDGQLCDAAVVKSRSSLRCYLPSPMFGPYSFINISDGREEREGGGTSWRNLAEVAIVLQILKNLYKAWTISKEEVSVGIISPYAGQVGAILARLPKKYENEDRFTVKVQTVDAFQGGEMDIIIISSVRSNERGSIGFLCNLNRTNVAITRARHCLWILGNHKTLIQSNSVWTALVRDAMDRQCFFYAEDDTDIGKAIIEVKKEYDQLEDLLNGSSSMFRNARWKVIFSDNFRKTFVKLTSRRKKLSVMNMLVKLSCGWRPKRSNMDIICESSGQIVKQFKAESLYVLCTIDIEKEHNYTQVLKIWDVLPLEEIDKLVKRLDSIYNFFSDDYISRCKEKSLEGDLEVPKAWDAPLDSIRRRSPDENREDNGQSSGAADGTSYAENSKVSESLLLMKFYSLSMGMVNHLLSDNEGKEMELPFEVTGEQEEIIKFPKSSFILGRSGTGKTTILTAKLFKKEQQFQIARNGSDLLNQRVEDIREDDELYEDSNGLALRQLFVTVSSKLCYAVKQQVSQLKSFVSGGEFLPDVEFFGCTDQFKDIPDSFVGVSENLYPLAITFHKFLMMLDGSIGVSYFERFSELRDICHGKSETARSLALQSFVRAKEVSYDKFCTAYWPRVNEKLTRKLDPSRVFTEIISHVKGGIQVGDVCDGKLSRIDYVALSEGRSSTLTRDEREKVYDIFQDYEQMKAINGEFDLSDLVNDLHRRLQSEFFTCDGIDFVYIDEVQDLTMRQIALFKYICKNVDEGYVFAGDTAQTIARGIDFRFEDIRCLFYNEFLQASDYCEEKGRLSKIFCLSQNFRTHAGVLKLAHSIINLLSYFFPSLVDALSPETSLICGEAPVFLESGDDKNMIVSIFGNSSSISGNVVGFGAEQVILVRDDCAREEVLHLVGKQALVLTIVECKGLEFQDVLLYNFFGRSPLKTQWRVIYEYMNDQDLLDGNIPKTYPHFDLAKHNIMCSELKQLYVAITRTRQRLWICENMEGFSKPMFDYWKKLCLIQVRKLDDDLAEAMKVASTPEEWKMQGYKLLREANYEMATMCFERAGHVHGEQLAKALGLNAAADQMHVSNNDEARVFRRQAAEIFESISMFEAAAKCFYTLEDYEIAGKLFESVGMFEDAAECFNLLKQYERAGRIYMEKCDVSCLERAGECFILAQSYNQAAEVYAKGQFFSECLFACSTGKLFELGLNYIKSWKGQRQEHEGLLKNTYLEIQVIEQDFLENCARHYHEHSDPVNMMKFVKAFSSVDAMRIFLKGLARVDELFSLGMFEDAAECLYLLKEYERAGRIYMEKCDVSCLKRAGECFTLAQCYNEAAEVYAKGQFFSECLSACSTGELFELGLTYIKSWKGQRLEHEGLKSTCSEEIQVIEQDFLENCARHYHEHGDPVNMMKFVNAFSSVDAIRVFLKGLARVDELFTLEEELGNFAEAANVAKMKGDVLTQSYMFGKAGRFKDASMCILWYVFLKSLSGGWPLKQFVEKEELLEKAKSYAMLEPEESFCQYVRTESAILLESGSSLGEVQDRLLASRAIGSLNGEILCTWIILDMQVSTDLSKFSHVGDLKDYAEEMISEDKVSVETLVHYWALWRDKILSVIQHLACLDTQDMNDHNSSYAEFCLNYLGVLKHGTDYFVLNPDADWVRNVISTSDIRFGKLISVEVLVSAAQCYWGKVLNNVGMRVLQTLNAISDSLVSPELEFHHCKLLTQKFEVANFLSESKFVTIPHRERPSLTDMIGTLCRRYFDYMFPRDWRKSLRADMICLRGTDVSTRLLEQTISFLLIAKPSYGQVGRLLLIILGSGKLLHEESYSRMSKCFESYPLWKDAVECLCSNSFHEVHHQVSAIIRFNDALKETFNINWRVVNDYISPICFVYLLERLLLLTCFSSCKYVFAAKSGFVEWVNNSHHHRIDTAGCRKEAVGPVVEFITYVVRQLLYNPQDTIEWIVKLSKQRSEEVEYYHRLLVLKLCLLSCLLPLNSLGSWDLLVNLVHTQWICNKLPSRFIQILRKGFSKRHTWGPSFISTAFKAVNDPLVIVFTNRDSTTDNAAAAAGWGSDSILFDTSTCDIFNKEKVMKTLFPDITNVVSRIHHRLEVRDHDGNSSPAIVPTGCSSISNAADTSTDCCVVSCSAPNEEDSNDEVKTVMKLWRILHALNNGEEEDHLQVEDRTSKVKEDLDQCLVSLNISLNDYIWEAKGRFFDGEISRQNIAGAIDDFKRLSAAIDIRELNNSTESYAVKEIIARLESRRGVVEPLMYQIFAEPPASDIVEVESSEVKLQVTDGKATSENKSQKNNSNKSKGRKNNKKKGGH